MIHRTASGTPRSDGRAVSRPSRRPSRPGLIGAVPLLGLLGLLAGCGGDDPVGPPADELAPGEFRGESGGAFIREVGGRAAYRTEASPDEESVRHTLVLTETGPPDGGPAGAGLITLLTVADDDALAPGDYEISGVEPEGFPGTLPPGGLVDTFGGTYSLEEPGVDEAFLGTESGTVTLAEVGPDGIVGRMNVRFTGRAVSHDGGEEDVVVRIEAYFHAEALP